MTDHEPPLADVLAVRIEDVEVETRRVLELLALTEQEAAVLDYAPIPWQVGQALLDDADSQVRTRGLLLALDAILQTPDVLVAAVRELHARLDAVAPHCPRLHARV